MAKRQELIDISGNTYNFLEVIRFSHIGNRRKSYWECKCLLCGKTKILRKDSFAYPFSTVKSCGCWHRDESRSRPRDKVNGQFVTIN